MSQGTVLSTAYLPPVQYMTKFITGKVFIEKNENYQKQSYRNRCCIYGANGVQSLVIPVRKNHGEKTPVTAIEIDYATNWQHNHLKSIQSAYQLSAFYEYYADEIRQAFNGRPVLLYDFNMKLLKIVLSWLGIKEAPGETISWENEYTADFRTSVNPKTRLHRPDPSFNPQLYQQVFSERFGFIPNLSIIDLIFNEGPQALAILRNSIL